MQQAIVTVIDLATLKAEPEPIKIAGFPEVVITSPDGARAFIPDQKGNLTVIDIADRKARTTKMRDCQYFVGGAATPDGNHLVLTCFAGNALVII